MRIGVYDFRKVSADIVEIREDFSVFRMSRDSLTQTISHLRENWQAFTDTARYRRELEMYELALKFLEAQ